MLARGQIGQRAMLKELKGAGNPSDDKLFAHFWRNDQKSECKAGRNQPVPNLHPPSRVIESFHARAYVVEDQELSTDSSHAESRCHSQSA